MGSLALLRRKLVLNQMLRSSDRFLRLGLHVRLREGTTTITRSPPSTCWVPLTASLWTTPATRVVMDASIFIASIVATMAPAATRSPTDTTGVTTPPKGAATCPAVRGSALFGPECRPSPERSLTAIRRSWPLIVHMTVRMPLWSGSLDRLHPEMRVFPSSISTSCSSAGCSP